MHRPIAFALAVTLAISATIKASALPTRPAGITNVIALSGNAAPGGGQYNFFFEPVINNQGRVAYNARLTGIPGGAGAGTPVGAYRYDGNVTTPIGGPGHASSPIPVRYTTLPALNKLGTATFRVGSDSGPDAVVRGDGGPLTVIAQAGQAAPGGGTFVYLPIDPRINDHGQVAFAVSFNATTGVTGGVYLGSGGALTEIARLGRPAPTGGNYTALHYALPINNSGDVAFAASTTGASSGGIFRGSGAATVKIAAQGDLAPDGDGVFAHLGGRTPAINDSGQVAFLAHVNPPSGPHYEGVFLGSGGAVKQIVRVGQSTPRGGEFSAFAAGPVINDRGQTAFMAFLKDPADPADHIVTIYRSDGTTLTEVMREGTLAPDGNGRFIDFGNPELSSRGHIAVMAELRDTVGAGLDDRGLYFYSDGSGLVQVAREGQPMLGSKIASIFFTGDLNHVESTGDEATGINNRGQLAFAFQLADGRSGVAVWQIPEPATAALLLMALAMQGVVRRPCATGHPARAELGTSPPN